MFSAPKKFFQKVFPKEIFPISVHFVTVIAQAYVRIAVIFFQNRITTAEKAIKAIKDNDYVVFSQEVVKRATTVIAEMKGMTFNECAQNLIAIAHPDFREGMRLGLK